MAAGSTNIPATWRSYICEYDANCLYPKMPRLFSKDYYESIPSDVVFCDPYNNEFQILFHKQGGRVYILYGWHQIGKYYKLTEGGWIHLEYLYDNQFMMTIKNHFMQDVVYPQPPRTFNIGQCSSPIMISDDDGGDLDVKPSVGMEQNHDKPMEQNIYRAFYIEYDPEVEYGRLPAAFNRKFYAEVARRVLLTDPAYNRILVKVSKKGNHLRFKDGWPMIGDIYNLRSGGWLRMYNDDPTGFTIQVLQRNLTGYVSYPRPPKLFRFQNHPKPASNDRNGLADNVATDVGYHNGDADNVQPNIQPLGDVDMCDAKPASNDQNGLADNFAMNIEYRNGDAATVQPHIHPPGDQAEIQHQDLTALPGQSNIHPQENADADPPGNTHAELNPPYNGIIMPNPENENHVVDHDMDYFYTLEKELSSYQATCSSLPLKADFCSRAFPLRNKTCILVDEEGGMWPCELGWPGRSRYECVLTSGWKTFARANELKMGSIIRFRVSKYDPTRANVVIIKN